MADAPPKLTVAPVAKFVPLIVTEVPAVALVGVKVGYGRRRDNHEATAGRRPTGRGDRDRPRRRADWDRGDNLSASDYQRLRNPFALPSDVGRYAHRQIDAARSIFVT